MSACQEKFSDFSEQDDPNSSRIERLRTIKWVDGTPLTKAVALKDKIWENGDTIRIKFLHGGTWSQELEQMVRTYSIEWLKYANLNFEFVAPEEDADVKIGFDLDSRYLSWSTIGTDCKAIPQDQPSANFVWLDPDFPEDGKVEILRIFGHILGLGFEHRSPESPIQFNSRAENYFVNTWGLSEDDFNHDIAPIYNTDQTNYSEYDPYSIMTLDIPRTIITNPRDALSTNMELSETDKSFIADQYPFLSLDTILIMVTTKSEVTFTVKANSSIRIEWGDGTSNIDVFTHTYTDIAEHTIHFIGKYDALIEFSCVNNMLKKLDISKNTALINLECQFNILTSLNVAGATSLSKLYCFYNILDSLNISDNNNLTQLSCHSNNIRTLNISHLSKLTELGCGSNPLSALDISHCPQLFELGCHQTNISTLDISNNLALTALNVMQTPITQINTNTNEKLISLDCSDTQIRSLDLSFNTKLKQLSCRQTLILALNVSNNPELDFIDCSTNSITELNINSNKKLTQLYCTDCPIGNLDLSNNEELKTLYCAGTQITILDVSSNLKISTIGCSFTPLCDNKENLNNFIESLPNRNDQSIGELYIYSYYIEEFSDIIENKNWRIK